MIELGRVHRLEDAHLVGDGPKVREKGGEFVSTLTMLGEFVGGAEELGVTAKKRKAFPFEQLFRSQLAIVLLKNRFVVEEVEMRWCTGHVKEDHTAGLGRNFLKSPGHLGECVFLEERTESEGTDPSSGPREEAAARDEMVEGFRHRFSSG
jgi:hypothetical protein